MILFEDQKILIQITSHQNMATIVGLLSLDYTGKDVIVTDYGREGASFQAETTVDDFGYFIIEAVPCRAPHHYLFTIKGGLDKNKEVITYNNKEMKSEMSRKD